MTGRLSCTLFSASLLCSMFLSGTEIPIPNGGFETLAADGTLAHWEAKAESTTENPHSGKSCARHRYAAGNSWNVMRNGVMPAKPETRYRLSIWNRNDVVQGYIWFAIREIDGKGETIGYRKEFVETGGPRDWRQYSMEFVSHSLTKAMQVYAWIDPTISLGTVCWDDVSLEELPPAPPALMSILPNGAASTLVHLPTLRRDYTSVHENGPLYPLDLTKQSAQIAVHASVAKTAKIHWSFHGQKGVLDAAPGATASVPLDLSQLPAGEYPFTAVLKDGEAELAQQTMVFRRIDDLHLQKVEPIKRVTVSKDGHFRVNGKIFLPVYIANTPSLPDMRKMFNEQFGGNILNVSGGHYFGDCSNDDNAYVERFITESRKQLDACLAANSYGEVHFNARRVLSEGKTFKLDMLRRMIAGVKDHPGLFMWALIDEPEGRVQPDTIRAAYRVIKETDPNHPVWCNYCNIGHWQKYAGIGDFPSWDLYEYPFVHLMTNAYMTESVRRLFEPGLPTLVYIQAWGRKANRREMPPEDVMKAEMYLALAQGCNSFCPYSWCNGGGKTINEETFACTYSSKPELQARLQHLVELFGRMGDFLRAPNLGLPCRLPFQVYGRLSEKGLLLVNTSPSKTRVVHIQLPFAELRTESGERILPADDGHFTFTLPSLGAEYYAPIR